MRWYSSLLIMFFFWANAAFGAALLGEKVSDPLVLNNTHSISSLYHHHAFSDKIENNSDYKQLKYSKKLSRYSWLKDKKPKVFSYYNNLSRIVFFHNLPPVNYITKEIFHVAAIEYDHSGNLRLVSQQLWTDNPPDCSNRLGGWKESNILYKGSITYYSSCTSII